VLTDFRYMPIVLKEFEKVGLLDAVVKANAINTEGMAFRTSPGKDNGSLDACYRLRFRRMEIVT
jgi:hypothetical protein